MKHETIRLGLTTCDAIVANGEINIITNVDRMFVEMKPLRVDRKPISFTHTELSELIC